MDTSGRVLGSHKGLYRYTIGQRRGIGVSAGPEPLYVLALDAERNRVVVGPGAGLFAEGLRAADVVLSDPDLESKPFRARVRIRQNHEPVFARVSVSGDERPSRASKRLNGRSLPANPPFFTMRTASFWAAASSRKPCRTTEPGVHVNLGLTGRPYSGYTHFRDFHTFLAA